MELRNFILICQHRTVIRYIVIIILIYIVFILKFFQNIFTKQTISGSSEILISENVSGKRILYWYDFYKHHCYFGVGDDLFNFKCPVNNCVVTDVYEEENVDKFDAIMFDMSGYYKHIKESKEDFSTSMGRIPEKRSAHQRYVFFLLEAPGWFNISLSLFNGFFNWTMTYRRDSDICRPYGYFRNVTDKGPSRQIDSTTNINWEFPNYHKTDVSLVTRKFKNSTATIAWVVSNCNTRSKRHLYVKELQKYVKVDVYGKCGTLKCPGRMSSECYEMLEKKYKFYLSFENALCKDYVTEKLFNIMKYNIVPVVYGGVDYNKVAPPASYINIKDFNSPKDLAEYLIYLDKHDKEYVKFFWWKSWYRVERDSRGAWCKLCAMLNSPHAPSGSYSNIEEWYTKDTCVYPDSKFPEVIF